MPGKWARPAKRATGGSTPGAFLNFVKQMFGAGVLALPHAFTWSGLVGGLGLLGLVLGVCCYSQVLLVKCLHEAQARQQRQIEQAQKVAVGASHHHGNVDGSAVQWAPTLPAPIEGYADLVRFAIGPRAGAFAGALVVLLELMFCSGWVIVACQSINTETGASHVWVAWVLFPLIAALCLIPSLHRLWPLSFVGLLVYTGGVMGTIYYHIGTEASAGKLPPPQFEWVVWSSMPRFIGTAAYGLEAILMVIPVARSLRHPAHAANIVGWGTATYAVFTTVFGVVAYLYGFGSCNAPGNGTMVTECLPSGIVSSIVRWALASTLVIGYPVILFPISTTLEGWLLRKSARLERRADKGQYQSLSEGGVDPEGSKTDANITASGSTVVLLNDSDPRSVPLREPCDDKLPAAEAAPNSDQSGNTRCKCTVHRLKQAALRVGAVACTCLVASAFEDISIFSSLVGALLVTLAGFVLPPIVHWNMRDSSTHWTSMVLDVLLILFGLTACAMGTTSVVQDLINATA